MTDVKTPEDKAEEKIVDKLAQVGAKKGNASQLDPAVLAVLGNITDALLAIRGDLSQVRGAVGKLEEKDQAATNAKRSAGPIGEGVPPQVKEKVHELLGEEFGVEVDAFLDRPAYTLHIIVPTKYAETKTTATKAEFKRKEELENLLGPNNPEILGKKERDTLYSELMAINNKIAPPDRRSCVITFAEGLPKVQEWCLKVKAKIAMAIINQGPKA